MPYRDPQHYKITMLFPMRYPRQHGGGPVSNIVRRWWLAEVMTILEGGTDSGIVEGWWRKEWDASRMVFAIVKASELEGIMDRLKEFLTEAVVEFKQQAMYLECSPVHYEEVSAQDPD